MEIEASKKARPLAGLTNKKLLDQLKAVGPGEIHSSFHLEFFFRFGKSLFKECRIICSNHKEGESLAKDIFQETIIKGIKNIYKFNYENSHNEQVVRNKVIGWLGTIAERELLNYFRSKAKEESADESLLEIESGDSFTDFDEEQLIPISLERLRLQEAVATLNDKERYIIMVCADYGCINIRREEPEETDVKNGKQASQKHLPDEVIDRLCIELNINKGNLRAIKKRVLAKLMAKLNEHF